MPRLLISVRSAVEARAALAGGADLIDVKEPREGALGAAEPAVWRDVICEVGNARPVSAALGELFESQRRLQSRAEAAGDFAFAKVGLAHMKNIADWPQRWRAVQRALAGRTELVAVIYADMHEADAPLPHDILSACADMGCRWALIDTYTKGCGSVFNSRICRREMLPAIVDRARELNMQIVLAGSLSCADLPQAALLAPDYIGVRGAACIGGRDGQLCEALVRQLSSRLRDFLLMNLNQRKNGLPVA